MILYPLPGTRAYQERLYPDPSLLNPKTRSELKLETCEDVIAHFTASSLTEDGIQIEPGSLAVTKGAGTQVLLCADNKEPKRYHSILDVNPIAAPGSGESEYQNDYFPINLTSMFYDNETTGHTYVHSMLELMLNPPARITCRRMRTDRPRSTCCRPASFASTPTARRRRPT